MIKVIGTRGSGKTTKLLQIAQRDGYVIVEPNAIMTDYVRHMAIENGYNVNVISAHELLYRQHGIIGEKYLVDELERFLMSLGVVGYSDGLNKRNHKVSDMKKIPEWLPKPIVRYLLHRHSKKLIAKFR